MSDQRSFERFVADNVAGAPGGTPLPDDFYDDMHAYASRTRQRPEWLAFIKEPPMRISSSLAVGSPTARILAIMVATLLVAIMVAGAGVAGSRLLAADGTIIVDQEGNGTVETITEAVEMAQDGDTILVRPGTYDESIKIDQDITITGDGEREAVIIVSDGVGTPLITFVNSNATLSNLTLAAEDSQVLAIGGAPTLAGLLFEAVGIPYGGDSDPFDSLYLLGGSQAQIVGNSFRGGGSIRVAGGSAPLIEGNELSDGADIFLEAVGESTIVRGNDIRAPKLIGITVASGGEYLIEGNTIIDAPEAGISPRVIERYRENLTDQERRAGRPGPFQNGDDMTTTIRANTISGSGTAIAMPSGAAPRIIDNDLSDSDVGISLSFSEALVQGNRIRVDSAGIDVFAGGSPMIDHNAIDAGGAAISIDVGASPTVTGNTLCGGGGVVVVDGATPVLENNEICASVATG